MMTRFRVQHYHHTHGDLSLGDPVTANATTDALSAATSVLGPLPGDARLLWAKVYRLVWDAGRCRPITTRIFGDGRMVDEYAVLRN